MKLFFVNSVSLEWAKYLSGFTISNDPRDSDYIVLETPGDPLQYIEHLKTQVPPNKLVFILSGDDNKVVDDKCIWFSNAVKPSGLAKYQTQIFVMNPAIFKYNYKPLGKTIDVFFKGTIWEGMRTEMYNYFLDKPHFSIEKYNQYWDWRLGQKPTSEDLENKSFELYDQIARSKISLCPKGNGSSSMRIVEALACKSVPVLINDYSRPFDIDWSDFCLVFFTDKHSWEYIHNEIIKLLNDERRLNYMAELGYQFYKEIVSADINKMPMYKDLNQVSFGFSSLIINKLKSLQYKN